MMGAGTEVQGKSGTSILYGHQFSHSSTSKLLLVKGLGNAVEEGPWVWAPTTLVGDPDKALGSCLAQSRTP